MKLVSGIVDSGFFAQSALSAEVATKDSLGRNISETYLTGVDQVISSYATATYVNSAIITNLNDLEISARQAYHARTAYYDQNGVNLANATNSAKSGYAASAWINAHSSDYQTTAGMTAYQSAGEYYSASNPSGFLVADDITGKLDASVYAADSGNFLTGVPAGTMNESAFGYDGNDKISGYNGSAFAGGSDVPEGVMVESGLEYNAVNEISAYNGSAIAQYGAEKQWLQHDDTIVHVANSAQYAFGVNLSTVAQLLGVDETVLWEGSANTGTLNFTDPLTSFKEFKFYVDVPERGINKVLTFYDAVNTVTPGFIQLTTTTMTTGSVVNDWWQGVYNINATINTATYKSMSIYVNGQYYKQCSTTACGTNASKLVIKKVVGIGRKA